ncbi:hypothetical protein ABTZ21_28525 [Streptomyces sp. NPDC096191]|uniref:hypothetical protein n=1 Tax=Streptomyces sp. NPDC096191 TaxID=3155426 RepID=UPI00332F4E16
MAWRPLAELADLAGTTVGAVRRYHDVGLLEEPPLRANATTRRRTCPSTSSADRPP